MNLARSTAIVAKRSTQGRCLTGQGGALPSSAFLQGAGHRGDLDGEPLQGLAQAVMMVHPKEAAMRGVDAT